MTVLTEAVTLTALQLRDDAEVLDALSGSVAAAEARALHGYARQCRRAACDLGRAAYAMEACQGNRPAANRISMRPRPVTEIAEDPAAVIARVAHGIRRASLRLTSVLTHPDLARQLWRSPRRAVHAWARLLAALTDPGGLGYSVSAVRRDERLPHRPTLLADAYETPMRVLAGLAAYAGTVTGQESLAARVAVLAMRLRMADIVDDHPEMTEYEPLRRLIDALFDDRQLDAVRAFRQIQRDRGTETAIALLAPAFTELGATLALLDENPFNDRFGWNVLVGERVTVEPLAGVNLDRVAGFDTGAGRAELMAAPPELSIGVGIADYMDAIATLGTRGLIAIHETRGPDGVPRYLLLAPGMAVGAPRQESPQDLVGAINNVLRPDSPYTRAIMKALLHAGVPGGVDLALVGHSEGGAAVMNLAGNAGFCARHTVTHVIAIGAPIDAKRAIDRRTKVASIVNSHDFVPTLDGLNIRSMGGEPRGWYMREYTDDTHEFPACHSARAYAKNLRVDVPDAATHIDAMLAAHRGEPMRTLVYCLSDD